MAKLKAPAWIAASAGVLWLVIGHGFANYDALYGLVWGQQITRGQTPQYDVSVAPTPHPLSTLAGIVFEPLGPGGSETALVVLAFLSLGALGYLVYRLGAHWFGPAAGALAAVLVLTREPVLSYGIRGYVDLPYVVLVLAALLVEARRPRAGTPVLVLLAVAGLLRPEAWLFSAAYVVWCWWRGARAPGQVARMVALAVLAPVLWALADLAVTGDPLWSLTRTRSTAETLRRVTGLQNVPTTMPRRLGEILREPVLFGAAAGGLMVLAWTRRRAGLLVGAGLVAVLAFCVLAVAGLPIITRYLLLPGAILCVFAGAGAFGWLRLEASHPQRWMWVVAGAVVVVAQIGFIPSQRHRLARTFDALGRQQRIESDLVALVRARIIAVRCRPVAAPNHRPVPLLALRLRVSPTAVLDAQTVRPAAGTYVDPANAEVQHDYTLDPHDPHPLVASVPPGFALVGGNRSWRVYERCARR
nr:MAG: hypothetical protein E6G56_01835 [Actinomycetota bacterium]